jgi:hypothetical protein
MYSSHRIDSVGRPVRLSEAPLASPGARTGSRAGEQPSLQLSVGDVVGQRPSQPRRFEPADRQPHSRRGRSHPPRDLTGRHPGRLQSDHIAHMAHRKPLRRHPGPPSQSRKAGPYRSQKRPRHPGRHHPGMVGEIISERWATSNRNGGRDHSGMVGEIIPEWWATSSGISICRATDDARSGQRRCQPGRRCCTWPT